MTRNIKSFPFSSLACVAACGFIFIGLIQSALAQSLRIVNGTAAALGAYPWMASIGTTGYPPEYGHFCGGSLIDPQHILTAAHCLIDFRDRPQVLQVTLNRGDLKSPAGEIVAADGVVIPDSYVPELNMNDVALLHLSHPVALPTAAPISPQEEAGLAAQASLTILGWGTTNPAHQARPDTLQEAHIPLISQRVCSERMGRDFDPASMVCAGVLSSSSSVMDGIDACYGDSGGPMFADSPSGPRIVGLTSWGQSCAGSRYYGVYSRVAPHFDWIRKPRGIAPFVLSSPQGQGAPVVGARIRCDKGQWGGDQPIRYDESWISSDGKTLTTAGSYRVRPSDLGKTLTCSVRAANAWGKATANSAQLGPVFPALTQIKATSIGAETAQVQCSGTDCRVNVRVKTPVIRVDGVLTKASCRHSGACGQFVQAKNFGKGLWVFRLSQLRGRLLVRLIQKNGAPKYLKVKI